jgi:hypothetical protein
MGLTVPYQGQERRVVRRARQGDEGFDAEVEQVIIKLGDGSEIVVPKEGDEGGGTLPPDVPPDVPPDASTAPPVVVDAPYASQTGNTLNCTMGNWTEEPDSYAYQWQKNGVDVAVDVAGANAANYPVTFDDVGETMTCVVTATNSFGSASSTSNEVIVA